MNNKIIFVDSREKPLDRARIIKQIQALGYSTIVSKQAYGDYRLINNDTIVVERKKTLLELSNTICGKDKNGKPNHERIVNEIKLAESVGAKIVFLTEHGEGIKKLEDIKNWKNPLLKKYPKATSGIKLYNILDTMLDEYNIGFEFCERDETGKKIIEILEGNKGGV